MRLQAKIETLTPVHIGSGTKYTNHLEFIYERENNDYWGGIVDIEKIYNIIGEENIHLLTLAIERKQNIFDFVKPYVQNLKLEDITKRIFFIYGKDLGRKQDIKEHIHSAGKPIIPGSSIKGAVRTAILSHLIKKFPQPAKDIINNYKPKESKTQDQWSLFDFKNIGLQIQAKYFSGITGRDSSNYDLMRFLSFSDVLFEKGDTMATDTRTLSLHRNGWEFKHGSQLTECLGQELSADLYLTLNDLQFQSFRKQKQIHLAQEIEHELVDILSSAEKLFSVINQHTRQLVQRELNFWQERQQNTVYDVQDVVQNYINGLEEILEAFTGKPNECILRLGAYEGWEFITGAWANPDFGLFNEELWQILFQQLNNHRDINIFPKSRSVDHEGYLMGFVRVKIPNQ